MSELKINVDDVVFFAEKNRIGGWEDREDEDGAPVLSRWGPGTVEAIREVDSNGRKTKHRYGVHFKARGLRWMRNQDLVKPEEDGPSLPCEVCGKFTRLWCRKETRCRKHGGRSVMDYSNVGPTYGEATGKN
jgi:hypothetical protein